MILVGLDSRQPMFGGGAVSDDTELVCAMRYLAISTLFCTCFGIRGMALTVIAHFRLAFVLSLVLLGSCGGMFFPFLCPRFVVSSCRVGCGLVYSLLCPPTLCVVFCGLGRYRCLFVCSGILEFSIGSHKSSVKAVLVNRLGDRMLVLAILWCFWHGGQSCLELMCYDSVPSWWSVAFLLGSVAKSAQFGWAVWLADDASAVWVGFGFYIW